MTTAPRVSEPAVLFDIDGTLTDTNYLHTIAWQRAFVANGYDVPTAWIHRRIGMGSSLLMEELIGEESDAAKKTWRTEFDRLKPEIRPLPHARDLLRAVAARGTAVVLASSTEEEDLSALLEAIDADDAISVVTSSGDVDQAKPSPEVFQVALEKAGRSASQAIVVGDTVWDVQAADRCGLRCVAVLTGGVGEGELRDAGAVAVYDDCTALLADLENGSLSPFLSRQSPMSLPERRSC